MRKDWSIKDLLKWTTRYFEDRGLQEPRLEAEILLAHVLQQNRVHLYANYEEPVNTAERRLYRESIQRRMEGEPSAYITGQKEFMSLMFQVSPDVLIPRPDTEVLVEAALELIRLGDIKRVCDVGTGSGAIAISLSYYARGIEVYATDISPEALKIADHNASLHMVSIRFYGGDLLEPLDDAPDLDLIVANLPYLTPAQIDQAEIGVRSYEPRLALMAEQDGLSIYRRLLPQALRKLRPGGYLLWEIDPAQESAARELAKDWDEREIRCDYGGRARVVKMRRPL